MNCGIKSVIISAMAFFITFLSIGNLYSQELQIGSPTPFQIILNNMPAIPIAGNILKFEFGGDTWIARLNGENFSAGSIEIFDTDEGNIITLKQTHAWGGAVGSVGAAGGAAGRVAGRIPGAGGVAAIGNAAGAVGRVAGNLAGWVENTGSDIVLLYNAGPPARLSLQN